MSDALARLCESVGETPETVSPGVNLLKQSGIRKPQPNLPAYLRRPSRTRKRAIIRAALGRGQCRWAYKVAVAHGLRMEEWRGGSIWNSLYDALWGRR